MAAVPRRVVEHVVDDVATAHRHGNKGTIEGPYYVPNAPELGAVGTMPMRDGEKGSPLVWEGTITSTDGKPLAGKVELWADIHRSSSAGENTTGRKTRARMPYGSARE